MKAIGTEDDWISFTAGEPVKGYWNYIIFDRSNSLDNEFEYVDISYGGGHHQHKANIYVRDGNSGASFKMSNSRLAHSQGYGLLLLKNYINFVDGGGNAYAGNELGDIQDE